jgi:hypothetical protein
MGRVLLVSSAKTWKNPAPRTWLTDWTLAASSAGAYMCTLIIDLWPVHRHAIRALPRVRADSKGKIHGVWLPSVTGSDALYEYRPIPAHLEMERYPPAQGPEDATPCGVRLVPKRGVYVDDAADETRSPPHSTRPPRDWYETGKQSSRRTRRTAQHW